MTPNQRRRLILAATSIGTAYLLFGSLPIEHNLNHDFMARLMDAAHFPLFLGLMLILIFGAGVPPASSAVMLFLSAGAVEVIQPIFDRSESLIDLQNGIVGILLGWLVAVQWREKHRFGVYPWISIPVMLLLLVPAYQEWQGIAWRRDHFPRLGSFEDPDELRLWITESPENRLRRTTELAKEGRYSLEVVPQNNFRASLVYLAGDRDWSSAAALIGDIYSSVDTIELIVRIDDAHDCTETEDRYNEGFTLQRGWNHLEIPTSRIATKPKNRKLDLSKIRRVIFFTGRPLNGALYFDNFLLTE